MAETTQPSSSTPKPPMSSLWLLLTIFPVAISVILYHQAKGFDPVALEGYSFDESIAVPEKYEGALGMSERVGDGLLPGPEDLAYDAENGFIYTGCYDGWIRRVRLIEGEEPTVEDWVRVGGRPLGLALGPDGGTIVVAEAFKGLLMVNADRVVHLLTDEAEGLKFSLTDGVDVALDGTIYFTDASYKYGLGFHMLDILGGRPYGRLMSYDPSTNQTVVLVRDLYFANGVSLSPDQQSLIFCESVVRKCKRYHIHGDKKGTVENFVEDLPGFPDNVRYDGEGHYWIALSMGRTLIWDILYKYPFLRKMMVALGKLVAVPDFQRDGGMLSVSLEGKPLTLYSDPNLHLVTGGLKIGKHLYYGSLNKPYISRIDLSEHTIPS